MKYNSLLKNAPKVSAIGLGAWQLGVNSAWKSMSEKEAIGMVHKALQDGVNFIDTAPNYGHGTSEFRLAKALQGIDRSKIVINTKFGHKDSGGTDFSSDYIRESLEGSLSRMNLDYVDSFIIHNPPYELLNGNNNDHYEILERLKEEGKIKAYGASLDTFREMKLFMDTTNGEVIEAFFNILHQDAAKAFDMALEKEVGIIAKVPLDSGWLTGKYNEDSIFNDIRSRWSRDDIRTRASLVRSLQNIIGDELSLSQIALSFCLAYEAVSTVIPGNVSIEQLEKNLASADVRISSELLKQLEDFHSDEVVNLALPW